MKNNNNTIKEEDNDTERNNQVKRPKKDHGEGSITKRKDGIWTARIQIGTQPNGKSKIKAFYGDSESEVKRKLKIFKKNNNSDIDKEQINKIAFGQYINDWLYNYKRNQLKDLSFDRLESTIKHHIIPNIGYIKINEIKQDNIQKLINKLFEEDKSYSSIKKVYDALNACFKHALIKDDIIKNPILGVTLPSKDKFEKKEITIFNEVEIENIKTELNRKYNTNKFVYYYANAYILILNTGIRLGEALGLQWDDINFNNKTIHIQRNVIAAKDRDEDDITQTNGYVIKIQDSTKTYAGNRFINLNTTAYQAILNLKRNSKSKIYVINNSKGNIVPPSNFTRTFYRVLDNVNINRTGVHTLRHTFASMLFKKGVDVKTVSEILGHSDVSITYNIYIHLINEQKKNAVELLDEI